jgi:hypothetical protein
MAPTSVILFFGPLGCPPVQRSPLGDDQRADRYRYRGCKGVLVWERSWRVASWMGLAGLREQNAVVRKRVAALMTEVQNAMPWSRAQNLNTSVTRSVQWPAPGPGVQRGSPWDASRAGTRCFRRHREIVANGSSDAHLWELKNGRRKASSPAATRDPRLASRSVLRLPPDLAPSNGYQEGWQHGEPNADYPS